MEQRRLIHDVLRGLIANPERAAKAIAEVEAGMDDAAEWDAKP